MKKPISFNSKIENYRNMANVGRPAGHPKSGGRKKGSANKVTNNLREFVNSLLNDNREQIIEDLQEVEHAERLRIYEKLLSYVIPKMGSTELKADEHFVKQITGMIVK